MLLDFYALNLLRTLFKYYSRIFRFNGSVVVFFFYGRRLKYGLGLFDPMRQPRGVFLVYRLKVHLHISTTVSVYRFTNMSPRREHSEKHNLSSAT